MPDYAFVLDRLVNVPLLAHPDKAATVAGVVLRRAGVSVDVAVSNSMVNQPKAGPLQEARLRQRSESYGEKPFLFAPDLGLAVIEITGSLAHRQWHIGKSSGVMGYDGIGAQLDAALADNAVKAIAFDIHSAGGEVPGVFPLADRIAAARGVKPMAAIADEMAFSAAYMLAAATGEVWLASPVAGVGSVGVAWIHVSFEEALKAEGIKPTIVTAGARKADGNPYEDLPDAVRERVQVRVDAIMDQFVARVAAWRGMPEKAVRALEADVFFGVRAVETGLADGISDSLSIVEALAAEGAAANPAALRAV